MQKRLHSRSAEGRDQYLEKVDKETLLTAIRVLIGMNKEDIINYFANDFTDYYIILYYIILYYIILYYIILYSMISFMREPYTLSLPT